MNTQTVVDLTQSLGWIINQEKSQHKPTQMFSFEGYKYHLDSALVKSTQERWLKLQDLILCLKSKHVLTERCLMSLIFARLNREDGPRGTPSHEALSVFPEGALEISSVVGQPPSLVRNYFISPIVVAKCRKRDEGRRPSPQRPQYPNLYRRLKQRLGRILRASLFKRSVVGQGKKVRHKCPRVEGCISGCEKVHGPVPKSNSVVCYGQLNSCSLHKQTRRNPLSEDVCSSVENHVLVPALPDNSKRYCTGRTKYNQQNGHCICRCSNRSVNVVHSSCRCICHSS